MRNSKLSRRDLMAIGRELERTFEPVTRLPLTERMEAALRQLAFNERAHNVADTVVR